MFSPFLRLFRRPHPVLGRLALGSLAAGALAFAPATFAPRALGAQDAPLTLTRAQAIARATSPDLRAATAALEAAAARERQAAAVLNPALAYGREQTSRAGQGNAQHIAQLEQPLELGGQRGIRVAAARARRTAAEARLAAARAGLDLSVTRAYADALAADRRAELAGRAGAAFGQARRVSAARLAAGDVSGYADRRLRLEAARYATLRAEAELARQTARRALSTLLGRGNGSAGGAPSSVDDGLTLVLADTLPAPAVDLAAVATDSTRAPRPAPGPDPLPALLTTALARRAELRASAADVQAAAADARLAARDRLPVPVLAAGFKTERVADPVRGTVPGFNGFVAGVSLPLPLWDRRAGAVAAAAADVRQRAAEGDGVRRAVAREVGDALAALRAVDGQLAALAPQLGASSEAALRAAQAAYAEGEVTLLEWLDAVRAYQEAEASYATLRAERLVRRAALERAVGAPLTPSLTPLLTPATESTAASAFPARSTAGVTP